jgi:hypothetical protein
MISTAGYWQCICTSLNHQSFHECPTCRRKRFDQANSVPPSPKQQQTVRHEPMAAPERAGVDKVRRAVRITSFRLRECDERNLTDKYFTDALVTAGILFDDSPQWAKVEVEQVIVEKSWEQRTEIIISKIQSKESC